MKRNPLTVSQEWEEQHFPVPPLEEDMDIQTVSLKYCKYDKKSKTLGISSEVFGGGFPREFFVRSHITGTDIRFVAINEYDILFDQDGWDGEMMVYRPIGNVPTVDHMVVHHEF